MEMVVTNEMVLT